MILGPVEAVLAVIRGELGLSALDSLGIHLQIEEVGGERKITVKGSHSIRVSPKPIDLAKGLAVHRGEPKKLRDWASFVLGASEIIDLERVDRWPEGDEILSALWDASFEGTLTEDELRIIEALVKGD